MPVINGKCENGHVPKAPPPKVEERRWGIWCVMVSDGTSMSGGILGRCYVMAETEGEAVLKGEDHLPSGGYPEYRACRIEVVV